MMMITSGPSWVGGWVGGWVTCSWAVASWARSMPKGSRSSVLLSSPGATAEADMGEATTSSSCRLLPDGGDGVWLTARLSMMCRG